MKRLSAALAIAALAVGAAPAAADPAATGANFPAMPTHHASQQATQEPDGTVALALGGVLVFVVIAGPLFGADSRPAWRTVDRKASFGMVGSMRPEDWPPSEFKR